ncbi:hypothetical protein BV20DRAFT_854482 [Pilatotrama ljubarskyi]|nr:hypothetical protein BV20DRAFT_854482 [Pilatotrama ljubarskyi]
MTLGKSVLSMTLHLRSLLLTRHPAHSSTRIPLPSLVLSHSNFLLAVRSVIRMVIPQVARIACSQLETALRGAFTQNARHSMARAPLRVKSLTHNSMSSSSQMCLHLRTPLDDSCKYCRPAAFSETVTAGTSRRRRHMRPICLSDKINPNRWYYSTTYTYGLRSNTTGGSHWIISPSLPKPHRLVS